MVAVFGFLVDAATKRAVTRQFISVMAYQEVNFPYYKISKKRSEYKLRKIYVIMEISRHLRASTISSLWEITFYRERAVCDSSHELNLACCQLEGRHLYCLSVRAIVKSFLQKTQRVFFKTHF